MNTNSSKSDVRRQGLGTGLLRGVAVAAALLAAPLVQAETLTQALSDAYRHSGLLEQNRAVLRAADEDVAGAVAALRPSVNYALSGTYTGGPGASAEGFVTNFRIASELTLYDFGRNRLAVEQQKENVLATRQLLLGVERTVMRDAVNAFFTVREAFETVSIRENNVRLITEELRAAEDRFEVGEVTRTDVAVAQSRLASARADLASARGDLAIGVAAYREAVGRAPGGLTEPRSLPTLPASVASAKAIARQASPDLLQLQHQIKATELALERAKRVLYPTVTGEASTDFRGGDGVNTGRNNTITLRLSGPISQGGALNSAIRQARAGVDQLRAELHVTRHAVDESVEVAYSNLAVAQARIMATDEQIRAATVAFRGTREEASLGARTTLDVLDAEQELLNARAGRIAAVAAQYRAAYGVLAAIGRLTAKDLGLPVQLYDPAGYYDLVKNAPQYLPKSKQGAQLERVLESLGKN